MLEATTTVHAVLPLGHSAVPPVVGAGVGVVVGTAVSPLAGVGVVVGVAAAGVGVAAAAPPSSGGTDGVAVAWPVGAFATGCGSPLSSTSASTSAASSSASTAPTIATGTRQRGVGAIRVPTACPQFRHHS